MIKAVAFDIGKVLADFAWEEYIENMPISNEYKERVKRATVLHKVWDENDRGLLTDEELLQIMCENDMEVAEYTTQFYQDLCNFISEYPHSKELLRQVKANGYQVYLLSNYGKTSFEYARERFSFFEEADGEVISYEIKKVKPEPEIYQCLLDKYGLKAEETLFVDDKIENVEGALQMGLQSFVWTSYEEGVKMLEERGIIKR